MLFLIKYYSLSIYLLFIRSYFPTCCEVVKPKPSDILVVMIVKLLTFGLVLVSVFVIVTEDWEL